jgi:hypothetical protein
MVRCYICLASCFSNLLPVLYLQCKIIVMSLHLTLQSLHFTLQVKHGQEIKRT